MTSLRQKIDITLSLPSQCFHRPPSSFVRAIRGRQIKSIVYYSHLGIILKTGSTVTVDASTANGEFNSLCVRLGIIMRRRPLHAFLARTEINTRMHACILLDSRTNEQLENGARIEAILLHRLQCRVFAYTEQRLTIPRGGGGIASSPAALTFLGSDIATK